MDDGVSGLGSLDRLMYGILAVPPDAKTWRWMALRRDGALLGLGGGRWEQQHGVTQISLPQPVPMWYVVFEARP